MTTIRVKKQQRWRQRIAETHDESRRQRLIAKLYRVRRDAPAETE